MYLIESSLSKDVLHECFLSDKDLLEKYHVASGSGLEGCVDKTFDDLTGSHSSFKFYHIKNDNELVGFFGNETVDNVEFLTSIFVKPSFRNKESMSKAWSLITDHFDNKPFISGIYAKNTRAAKFFERNGGKVVEYLIVNNHPVILYGFNLGE